MTNKKQPSGKPAENDRAARLAAELRANLKKRKVRAREEPSPGDKTIKDKG